MTVPVNNLVVHDDVVERAKANLLYQFKDIPNINTLVKIFAEEVQEIENETNKLLVMRTLEEAEGAQLDDIGLTLGITRSTSNDEEYRNLLKIRNVRQTGTGSADSVIQLLRLFTGDENVSLYKGENYFVDITYNATCNPLSEDLNVMALFFPVVTALRATITLGTPFGFEGDGSAEGFSSIHDVSAGGSFVSRLQVPS